MKTLSVDPSINRIGLAYFVSFEGVQVKTITTQKMKGILERLLYISDSISRILLDFKPEIVLIEYPDSWTRSGANVKSLQKLSMAIGTIISCASRATEHIELIRPREWNPARLPAKQVKCHIKWLYDLDCNEHEAAAVAMAHYYASRRRIEQLCNTKSKA